MRIDESIVVEATRGDVWELLADPARYPAVLDWITRMDPEDPDREPGQGARYDMRVRVGSADVGGLVEVIEYDECRDVVWTSVTGVEQRGRMRLRDASGGRCTRVTVKLSYNAPGAVLGTLAEVAAERRVDLRGVVDRTQMDQVVYQWRTNGHSAWKIPILASVLENADFKGKRSIQWSPETPHDFMHAKVTIADDVVFAGSFNLSRSGELNAENVLEIEDPALADRLAGFVDEVRARYPPFSVE